MPEGHTIHRAARDQRPMLAGQLLDVSSPQGRFMDGAARLDGRRCTGIDAYGKHLLYRFDDLSLHIHLGLFGRFRCAKRPAAEPKGEVRVRMMSDTHVVDINGPNSCEVLDPASDRPVAAGERVVMRTGGGGGYGDPRERPVDRVVTDVVRGYVSVERARDDYGVVVDPATLALDAAATAELRGRTT